MRSAGTVDRTPAHGRDAARMAALSPLARMVPDAAARLGESTDDAAQRAAFLRTPVASRLAGRRSGARTEDLDRLEHHA